MNEVSLKMKIKIIDTYRLRKMYEVCIPTTDIHLPHCTFKSEDSQQAKRGEIFSHKFTAQICVSPLGILLKHPLTAPNSNPFISSILEMQLQQLTHSYYPDSFFQLQNQLKKPEVIAEVHKVVVMKTTHCLLQLQRCKLP